MNPVLNRPKLNFLLLFSKQFIERDQRLYKTSRNYGRPNKFTLELIEQFFGLGNISRNKRNKI